MRATIGLVVAGILAASTPFPFSAHAEPPPAAKPAPAAEPASPEPAAAAPAPTPAAPDAPASPRLRAPISRSIDRHVDDVVRAHQDPCATAQREGTPCFPVTIESKGPTFSVKESLREYEPDKRPTPGVPTVAEIQQQMSGAPLSASGGVSTDPVCTVKSLVRSISGGTNTFYLYRLRHKDVERPLLTDHKLDVLSYAARVPGAQLEFLGEYSGECDAIAAWRKALREAASPPADERTSIGVTPKP